MAIKEYSLDIDERSIPNIENKANAGLLRLVNVRWHPNGYYISDRGWENLKVWPDGDAHPFSVSDFEPITFVDVYTRHESGEVYYIYEQDGYLKYDMGNGESSEATHYLPSEIQRNIPEPTEPGTQLIPIDNWALICNGHDDPFKFFGGILTTPFGFRSKPAPPQVYDTKPAYHTDTDFGDTRFVTALKYEGSSAYGVTESTETGIINYAYAVSFVSDTGSESPLSELAILDFTVADVADEKGQYIPCLNLPIGPPNTRARRVYRSQQRSRSVRNAGNISNDLFFVRQVNDNTSVFFTDHYPDSHLRIKAPTPLDSVPIVGTFNYAAAWDSRTWISGGPVYSNKVLFSEPSKPEQFGAFSFIQYPTGGAVTALVTFNQYLLVFREHSIDVITKPADTYKSVTITNSIGTTATNTIRVVDGIGLVFLSYDGFYAISLISNNQNQPVFDIAKISENISPTIFRLNINAMPRATATYNPVEREYWCHMPVDGLEVNTLGCVLHQNGQWSFRRGERTGDYRQMAINCLATDGRWTIMGMIPWDEEDAANIQNGTWRNLGLQVWSGSEQWSTVYGSGSLVEGSYTFTSAQGTRIASSIESIWLTFGSEHFYKKIKSLEILALGVSNKEITLEYAKDFNLSGEESPWIELEAKPLQASHVLGSEIADAVYNTATFEPIAEWGVTRFNDPRTIRLRWDFPPENVLALKFRFSTTNVFAIHSYIIDYEITNVPIVNTASRRS